ADFRRTEDGIVEVRWRAAAQKGKGYGRGDVVLPATRQLEVVYRWLTRFHPNPLGPEYPLIWAEDDPTQAEPYHRLRRELAKAWRESTRLNSSHVKISYAVFCLKKKKLY